MNTALTASLKTCEWCKKGYRPRAYKGGRPQRFCSDRCMNKAHRANNLSRYRDHELKKYGLSLEDYNSMLIAQDGRCAICKRRKKKLNLAVDHNHKTGAVRGLLCAPCNRHVGWFEAHGQAVVDYLKRNE